jgi:hypothetical protein
VAASECGRVISGLLTGIVLFRALSSVTSDIAGWRVVYLGFDGAEDCTKAAMFGSLSTNAG